MRSEKNETEGKPAEELGRKMKGDSERKERIEVKRKRNKREINRGG